MVTPVEGVLGAAHRLADRLGVDARRRSTGRQPGRVHLDPEPHVEQFLDVLHGQLGDDRAPTGQGADEAVGLELWQCLAQRDARDGELLRELTLAQPRPGREVAPDDASPQFGVDARRHRVGGLGGLGGLIGRHGGEQRAHGRFRSSVRAFEPGRVRRGRAPSLVTRCRFPPVGLGPRRLGGHVRLLLCSAPSSGLAEFGMPDEICLAEREDRHGTVRTELGPVVRTGPCEPDRQEIGLFWRTFAHSGRKRRREGDNRPDAVYKPLTAQA